MDSLALGKTAISQKGNLLEQAIATACPGFAVITSQLGRFHAEAIILAS